jgi:hypothetical protein
MEWNTDDLAPQSRERYVALGQRYGSESVLAQADKALHGRAQHAAVLRVNGFGDEEWQLLAWGRDALAAQCTRRDLAAMARKVGAQRHVDVRRDARRVRLSSRTMLQIAMSRLLDGGASEAAVQVQTALQQTRRLSSVKALPVHLQILLAAMRRPEVAAILASRGGPEAEQRIEHAYDELRASMEERASHTPVTAEAEQRTLLAGLIVALVRSANDAARLAARSLGMPSIAAEFKLTHLAPWRRRQRKTPAPEPTPGAPELAAPGAGAPGPAQ